MENNFTIKPDAQVQHLMPFWQLNDDLEEGPNAMYENRHLYFEKLELDSDEDFAKRVKRSMMPCFSPSVKNGFVHSTFEQKPYRVLDEKDTNIDNVNLLKDSIDEYSQLVVDESLKQGGCITIVDYSEKLNRPYFKFVKAKNILIIRSGNKKGYPELSMVAYYEDEEVQDETDEFITELVRVTYVWDIHNNQVRVRRYEREYQDDNENTYQRGKSKDVDMSDVLKETNYMQMNGKQLESLPIVVHGANANNYHLSKSVLQKIAYMDLKINDRWIDLIELLHLTAMPTPVITGMDANDPSAPKTLGPGRFLFLDNPDATAFFLELDGKSYSSHKETIEEYKETMANLGAQILQQGGLSRETATSVLVRTKNETSTITGLINNISSQMVDILKIYFEWMKKPTDNIVYKLNSDFVNITMEPNQQIALVKSFMEGVISHKTVFEKLKEGEIIAANKSFEEELADIASQPPSFPSKEKDAEVAEDMAKLNAELTPKSDANASQEEGLKGSNMETGNSVKNTEVPK